MQMSLLKPPMIQKICRLFESPVCECWSFEKIVHETFGKFFPNELSKKDAIALKTSSQNIILMMGNYKFAQSAKISVTCFCYFN